MAERKDGELYVDGDGYVCFDDGGLEWTLHSGGWVAFMPGTDVPVFETGAITYPSDTELTEARDAFGETPAAPGN